MNNRSPGYPLECVTDFIWPDPNMVPPLMGYPEVDESKYVGKSLPEVKGIMTQDLQKTPKLLTLLNEFFANINKQSTWENKSRSDSFKDFDSLPKQAQELAENGSVVYTLPDSDMLTLKSYIQNDIDKLINSESRGIYSTYDRSKGYDKNGDYIRIVDDILRRNGILGWANDYFGYNSMHVATVTLHVAMVGDIHLRQVFSDIGYGTDLFNLHFDPKGGTMKCILYLDDVGLDDGPFTYIPQSHRYSIPQDTRLAAKANCTGNYLDSELKRRFFMSLPERLRKTSIYGPLCIDGSEINSKLQKKLVPFTSNLGNAILFDPAMSHVGGACKSGRRINLQIAIRRS